MGLYEKLEGVCKEITWHWGKNATKELFLKAMTADVYITSANAISENGEIVNIDGNGNRVAASIYGPDEIIFLIGKNKICKDIDEAVYRARNIAAPLNARRLNKNTPCAKDLKCHNCERDDCFCNIFTVHRRKNSGIDAEVILINESLGF